MQIFQGTSSSKPQTIQTQTSHLAAASWVLPEGRGCGHILLKAPKRQQLSDLFVFVLFVALKKGFFSVLSYQKAFCLTFCVFDNFFQNACSQLCFIVFSSSSFFFYIYFFKDNWPIRPRRS